MRFFIITLILTALSNASYAADDKGGAWLGVFTKKYLSHEYYAWTEAQMRYSLDQGGMGQTLFRGGLLKTLDPTHEAGLLYAFIQSSARKEHRFTFQHAQKYGNFAGFSTGARTRLEGRTLENSDDDAIRARYLLRGERSAGQRFNFLIWNEVFLNLTDDRWTGERSFERNRLFVGARFPSSAYSMELGYLNQFVPREDRDVSEHILTLYLFF